MAGDTLKFSATLGDGAPLPSWLTFDPAKQSFNGMPTDQTTGSVTVKITATDQGGLSSSTTLGLQVNPTYRAPSAGQSAYAMVSLGQPMTYMLPSGLFWESIPGDTLSYSAVLSDGSPLPAWLTFEAAKQTFTGTPPGPVASTLDIKITATDMGGLSASTPLSLQLQPNVFDVSAGVQTVSVPAGQTAIFESGAIDKITAGDEDHVLLVTGAIASATLGMGNNSAILAGAIDTLTVGDGRNTVTLAGSSDTLNAGNGNNDVTLIGSSDTVNVGGGSNNVTLAGAADTMNAGNGDNTVTATGTADTITVGSGTNTIVTTGIFATLNLGDGNDTATLKNSFSTAKVGHGTYNLEFTSTFASKLTFGSDVASDHLWFEHVGQDLRIDVIGSTEMVTVKNWYASSPEHVSQITAGDGKSLSDVNVEKLVQAMASFAPPSAGQTAMTTTEQQQLQPVLAANWR